MRDHEMRILEEEPRRLDDTELQNLIRALRRTEQDFRSRVAEQVSALASPEHMHGSNPVYKSLRFMLDKVSKQLRRAEEELSIRASVSARDRPHARGRTETTGIAGMNGWSHGRTGNI